MGVTVDLELANACQGVYTFRIQGAVVHEMSTLWPVEGQPSKFTQIYFYDPDEQATQQAQVFDNILQQECLREIQTTQENSNRFCHLYKTIREHEAEQGSTEGLTIVLKAAREVRGCRQRQYDLPSANEVAVLLPGDGTATEPRDIHIEGQDGHLKSILDTHPAYDPLQYVLLHPRGEDGWTYHTYLLTRKEDVPPAYPDHEQAVNQQQDQAAGVQEENFLEDLDAEEGENDLEDQDPEDLDSDQEDEEGENRARDKFITACAYYAYHLQVWPVSDTDGRCYFWLFG